MDDDEEEEEHPHCFSFLQEDVVQNPVDDEGPQMQMDVSPSRHLGQAETTFEKAVDTGMVEIGKSSIVKVPRRPNEGAF